MREEPLTNQPLPVQSNPRPLLVQEELTLTEYRALGRAFPYEQGDETIVGRAPSNFEALNICYGVEHADTQKGEANKDA